MSDSGILGGIVQLAVGSNQKKQASKIDTTRPQYVIPKEIFQNQAMYRAMANSSRVPGQQYIENNIGQNTAQSLSAVQNAAGSSADALAMLGGIQQNALNQYNQLGIQGAEMQMANKDKLAAANNTLSEYKDKRWDLNSYEPYKMKVAKKEQLEQAAWNNMQTGANQIAAVGDEVGKKYLGI